MIGSRAYFVHEVPAVEVAARWFGCSTVTACGIRRLTQGQRDRTGPARRAGRRNLAPPSSNDPGATAAPG